MFLSRRFILTVSQLKVGLIDSQKTVSFSGLKKLNASYCECRKKFQTSAWRYTDKIPSSVTSKYETFTEKTSPVILDIEEEREKIIEEEIKDPFAGLNLKRGVTGVFDIEELIQLLQREKAQDIFVVRIPPEANYADYMVLVTSKSKRQMLGVLEFIRKVFKRKMSSKDVLPHVEGENSNEWMAMDLGNIIVHMFSKSARNTYDLESLWSVGREYDELSQEKEASGREDLSDYRSILAKLIPDNAK